MSERGSQLTVREVKELLSYFKRLRRLSKKPLPKKSSKLWAEAKDEATREFIESVKRRSRGVTFRPSGGIPVRKQATPAVQAHFQKMMDHNVVVLAEKKYFALDSEYRREVEEREKEAKDAITQIDLHITPLISDLAIWNQAKDTLLVADWQRLQRDLSTTLIMQLHEVDAFDRAIVALQVIHRRLKQKHNLHGRLWGGFCQLYDITVKRGLEAVLHK